MKLPRDLGGRELAHALCRRWDYVEVGQVGSHISLVTKSPSHQRISIPEHKHLKTGMLNGILRAVALHKRISKQELLQSLT